LFVRFIPFQTGKARSLAEPAPAVEAPATSQASEAEPTAAARPKLDVSTMPFRVFFEVRSNDANKINRAVAGQEGWSAELNGDDCSHTMAGENLRYGGYTRIKSPELKLSSNGLEQIAKALSQAKAIAPVLGKTASMHIDIPESALDDRGVTNLVNLHLAYEPIIYRICSPGGRKLYDKFMYCTPPSTGSTYTHKTTTRYTTDSDYHSQWTGRRELAAEQTVSKWRSEYSNRHWGLNASDSGWWQFRYLDASYDAQAVETQVRLAIALVKAATDGDVKCDRVRVLHDEWDKQVPREVWDQFISTVAKGDDAFAERLQTQFTQLGGKLEPDWLPGPARKAVRTLLSDHSFADPTGKKLGTAETIRRQVQAGEAITITPPQGASFTLPATQIAQWAYGQSGALDKLEPGIAATLKTVNDLRTRGVNLTDANGQPLTSIAATLLSGATGQVQARVGTESVAVGSGGMVWTDLVRLHAGQGRNANEKALFEALPYLRERGYSLHRADGSSLAWPPGLAVALAAGDLRLTRAGQTIDIRNASDLDTRVYYPETYAALSAEDRQRVDEATALAQRGRVFTVATNLMPGTTAFVKHIVSPDAALRVSGPQGSQFTATPRLLHALWSQQTGQPLEADLTRGLQAANELTALGFTLQLAGEPLLAALANGQPLGLYDPLGRSLGTVEPGGSALAARRQEVAAPLESQSPEQRQLAADAVALLTQKQMTPLLGNAPLSTPTRLAYALQRGETAELGMAGSLRDWNDVRRVVSYEKAAPAELPAADSKMIEYVRGLRDAQVQFYYGDAEHQATPVPLQSTLLDRLRTADGVRVLLPRRKWWHFWPRKTFVISGEQDLKKLARKFGLK
jgi:hypothetical protein